MAGSHALEHVVNEVARDIEDPETRLTVWKRRQLASLTEAKSAEERVELRKRPDLRMAALGSGSDFTAFLDHLGIATLDLGFGGEDPGGIYHSIYDSFSWYTRFSDGEFLYGRALAQLDGTLVLRLASAEALPLEFTGLAETVAKYQDDLKTQLKKKQEENEERTLELDEGAYAAASDPRRPTFAPPREPPVPHLNVAPLENATEALTRSAARFEKVLLTLRPRLAEPQLAAAVAQLNQRLLQTERTLTSPQGLPRRPWFRHLLYAPGLYSGYAPRPVPGVTEGFEAKNWGEAEAELARVAAALQAEARLLDTAGEEVQRALEAAKPAQ
jgi:N-acetylated-alpha-linked acidic dipeptidase